MVFTLPSSRRTLADRLCFSLLVFSLPLLLLLHFIRAAKTHIRRRRRRRMHAWEKSLDTAIVTHPIFSWQNGFQPVMALYIRYILYRSAKSPQIHTAFSLRRTVISFSQRIWQSSTCDLWAGFRWLFACSSSKCSNHIVIRLWGFCVRACAVWKCCVTDQGAPYTRVASTFIQVLLVQSIQRLDTICWQPI